MYTIAILIFISLLWYINSGNCVVTEKINKRFIMLAASVASGFYLCISEWDWALLNTQCFSEYFCGWIGLIGLLITSFILLSISLNEILLKIAFRAIHLTRDYSFEGCYRNNILVVLGYFAFLSFGYTVKSI